VIDKIGRKPLLLVGSAGMAVTLGVLTWCFSTATTVNGALHLAGNTGVVALVAANAYVVFFNLSWGPVMWVMLGEMFPNQMRGSALAVAGFAQWIANFAISVSFPAMAAISLPMTYGFYASAPWSRSSWSRSWSTKPAARSWRRWRARLSSRPSALQNAREVPPPGRFLVRFSPCRTSLSAAVPRPRKPRMTPVDKTVSLSLSGR
jgi:hypothetical protein